MKFLSLVIALSEAFASSLSYLLPALNITLGNKENGVRFGAATAIVNIATIFPAQCLTLLHKALDEIKSVHDKTIGLVIDLESKHGSDTRERYGAINR